MYKKCCPLNTEIPLIEIKQQVEYARTLCSDIFTIFSNENPDTESVAADYPVIRTKLSMMMDFLFQAKIWCDTLNQDI